MKERVPAFPQANAGLRRRGLHIGQSVEVKRALAGLSGVLIGFRNDHNCVIELDVVECGVVLIIDVKKVKERFKSAPDRGKSMRAPRRD